MFNTEELYHQVGGEMLRRRGKQLTEDLLDNMMGRQSRQALQIMIDWHDLSDTAEELEAETDVIFGQILETDLRPMPGLLDLLEELEKRKIPKAIATSSRRGFAVVMLEQFALLQRFRLSLDRRGHRVGKT